MPLTDIPLVDSADKAAEAAARMVSGVLAWEHLAGPCLESCFRELRRLIICRALGHKWDYDLLTNWPSGFSWIRSCDRCYAMQAAKRTIHAAD